MPLSPRNQAARELQITKDISHLYKKTTLLLLTEYSLYEVLYLVTHSVLCWEVFNRLTI